MALDVSGFGLVVNLIASNTFPAGLVLTQFAADTDPLDLPRWTSPTPRWALTAT